MSSCIAEEFKTIYKKSTINNIDILTIFSHMLPLELFM